jgi:hypothetical protein
MKNIFKATVIIMLIFIVLACNVVDPKVLIPARIDDFEADLNSGDYSLLKNHFHPDMVSYETYLADEVIISGPLKPGNAPFTLGIPVITDSSTGYTASGNFDYSLISSGSYVAEMREDGDSWKIYAINFYTDAGDFELRSLK